MSMKIIYTSQFKKDYKRYKNDTDKIERLAEVINMLANGEELPERCRPHKLSGQYNDCMECHVGGDFLLIWIDQETEVIELVRVGSHSELFGHGKKK